MKANSRKYLLVVLLTACIVPSVALASWWNPFTWKIFHKREVPNQEIIKDSSRDDQAAKITELQKQVDDLKKLIPVKQVIVPIINPQVQTSSNEETSEEGAVQTITDEKESLTKEYQSKLSTLEGRIATLLAEYKSDLGELKIRITTAGSWTPQQLNSQIKELSDFANMNINALKKNENDLFLEYKAKGLYTLPPPNNTMVASPGGIQVCPVGISACPGHA